MTTVNKFKSTKIFGDLEVKNLYDNNGVIVTPASIKLNGVALGGAQDLSTYQTIANMVNYLTTANATSTYQTISNMSSYLTTVNATSTYQTITNANTLYQLKTAMSSYLTTANATSTYQTISNMSSYLTTANATSTYLTKDNFIFSNFNTVCGSLAFDSGTTGANNTIIGQRAGTGITTGANNTCIGDLTSSVRTIMFNASSASGVLTITGGLSASAYSFVGCTITGIGLSGTVTITSQLTSVTGFFGQQGTYQLSTTATFASTNVTASFPQFSNSSCLGKSTGITDSNQITLGRYSEYVRIAGELVIADSVRLGSTGTLITANRTIILPAYQYYPVQAGTTAFTITLPTIYKEGAKNNVGTRLLFRRNGGTPTTVVSFIGNGTQVVNNTALTGGSTAQALMGSGVYKVELIALQTNAGATTFAWFQI